ncbi:MAG: ABC transporter permease subunit [Polyangiaceae bacterium]|nr:ABC transporter permease subunit [Polyangiaceae bacterium]
MLARVLVIALNTYREAVRARVLHGLFGLAIGTGAYALVVGQFALRDTLRVVSDLGAASISLYAIIVAIVLGATSLYRELELKTVFPILARPIRRSEYLVGKYLGTLLTLAVFVAANAGALLLALGALAGGSLPLVLGYGLGGAAVAGVVAFKRPRIGTYVPIVWALAMLIGGWVLSSGALDDRRVILGSATLTVCEVAIVAAIATVFASFSSPFLTAVFTFGVFLVGRSADTLARLPHRVFGKAIQTAGELTSRVVPNLMLYVPPRTLLTGEAAGVSLGEYLSLAALSSLAWAAGLLAFASLVFRRRDFL